MFLTMFLSIYHLARLLAKSQLNQASKDDSKNSNQTKLRRLQFIKNTYGRTWRHFRQRHPQNGAHSIT